MGINFKQRLQEKRSQKHILFYNIEIMIRKYYSDALPLNVRVIEYFRHSISIDINNPDNV